MTPINTVQAARKFGPGYFIREQMELREWTQDDLSQATGLSAEYLQAILQGKQPLAPADVHIFASIFNNSVQYWTKLNDNFEIIC